MCVMNVASLTSSQPGRTVRLNQMVEGSSSSTGGWEGSKNNLHKTVVLLCEQPNKEPQQQKKEDIYFCRSLLPDRQHSWTLSLDRGETSGQADVRGMWARLGLKEAAEALEQCFPAEPRPSLKGTFEVHMHPEL